ncbi:response regulator [Phenylobacterium hankyongense]|uniref:Response regulator n=1 Tax=Phenylobacterium hankyongense TaxID=1813876 RepID=A0A328AZ39_9CAUL|nr:response regulator [Phenylobacterium hankyongense]RAK58864.1 response regulator [Phenylobacterium hankyongense]
MTASPEDAPLHGRKVLVVEDQYLIAAELRHTVMALGGEVLGPCATVADAMTLLERSDVDFALLDVNLRGETAFPVAAALDRRGVPFAFATGYEPWVIPPVYRERPRLEKPVSRAKLQELAAQLLGGR